MSKKIDELIQQNISPDGTILNLREKFIGLRGIMELAGNPVLKSVKELILPGNQCADEGVEALAESPYLENLEILNLNHNDIGDDGAIAIAIPASCRSSTTCPCSAMSSETKGPKPSPNHRTARNTSNWTFIKTCTPRSATKPLPSPRT